MLISKFVNFLSKDKIDTVIWHSLYGRVMQIPDDLAIFLRRRGKFNLNEFVDIFDKETLDFLIDNHIIIKSKKDDNDCLEKLFNIHNPQNRSKIKYLSLIMSEECPFRCTYCIHFANSKHYYSKEKMMSYKVAKQSIDNYLRLLIENNENEFYINLGGGEPLLNYKTISMLLPYIKKCEKKYAIKIKVSINSNLSLLTRGIAKKLIAYNVEIAGSLDGTKRGNDKVRLTKNLNGTYDSIVKSFKLLRDLGSPLDGFAMTVTEENLEDVDTMIVDWAESMGMKEIRIDIDVVGMVKTSTHELVEKIMYVRKYAAQKGISIIGFWSRPAENLGLIPEKDDVGFCGGERGNSICVAPNGEIYPCGYSNYKIGDYTNIETMFRDNAYQQLLARRHLGKQPEKCKLCPIFGFCRGGCMITREVNGDNSKKQDSMCRFYVEMTKEIILQQIEA